MSDLFSFTLDCGREVSVCDLSIWGTYEGWLEGCPDPCKYRDFALKRAKQKYQFSPVHLIPPVMEECFPGHDSRPALPHNCLLAFMRCWKPVDPSMDLSHLAVLWFEPDIMHRPLKAVLHEALRAVPWVSVAKDGLI